MRRGVILSVLALLVPASLVLALAVGSVALAPEELWRALAGTSEPVSRLLVFELRLPRALVAFAVGGLLALAGALLQVLLRNPLADPYVIGVSGGAAVAALLALLTGAGVAATRAAAFGGALGSTLLVFALGGRGGTHRLLLTGVVVAAGWGACISLLLVIAPSGKVHGMLFWLLGDLSNARHSGVGLTLLAFGLAAALAIARALNVLARGEETAAVLGERPARLRTIIYALAALFTATAVTLAGNIGFVGLVIPHMLRLIGLADHRYLLPGAVLLGGSLLVCADTLARSVIAPVQLPVGILTALLGVPVFLFLLARGTRAAGGA